ncbi:MAG: hypothetical protein MUO36_03900 [Candidatus Hadarchaeum sp.]|nr:hypothetical protein [Candidatus Hadarchaeum sp.]
MGKTPVGLDKKNYSLTVMGVLTLTDFYAYRRKRYTKLFKFSIPIIGHAVPFLGIEKKKGFASRDSEPFEKNLDDLMKNYEAFFPLIAGKWDFFRKKGIDQRLIKMLGITDTSDAQGHTKAVFIDFFDDALKEPKALLKVVKVFSEDPDLRHVAYESMKILHERHRSLSMRTEKILRILERQNRAPQSRGERAR